MNDNTRRQWERYCDDHPDLDPHERLALYWLVHMHSAREGFTRPGVRLLGEKTGLSKNGVTGVLRHLHARGAIELKEPAVGRLAALWTIPWLLNVAPSQRGANEGTKRGANEGTSTPLRGVGAPASADGRERHPSLQPKLRPEIVADNEYIAQMGYGR